MVTKRSSHKSDLEYYSILVDKTYQQILQERPSSGPNLEYYAHGVLLLYRIANPVANAIVEKQSLRKRKVDIVTLKAVMQDRLEIMSKFLLFNLSRPSEKPAMQ